MLHPDHGGLLDAHMGIVRVALGTYERPRLRAMASPVRLMPIVSSAIIAAGASTAQELSEMYWRFADHQRPVRLRRLQTEAEEVDRGDDQDLVGEAQTGIHQHRGEDVGQNLAHNDGDRPLAARHGRLDVAAHRDLERRRAHDTADPGRLDRRHADDQHPGTGARAGDQHQQEQQRREREHHVHGAHQDRVGLRAAVARHQPDGEPDRIRQQGCSECQAEHRTAAVQQAAEHVTAEIVGAEQRVAGGRGQRVADRRVGVMRREVAAEHGHEHDEQNDRDTDRPRGRAEKPQPAAHAGSRSLGTSRSTIRSATRFSIT